MQYNPKCVALSVLVVGGYWMLPNRSAPIAVGLAIATYAGLAWYDKLYNCDERLRAFGGPFGAVTAPFKPAADERGRYTGEGAVDLIAPSSCG